MPASEAGPGDGCASSMGGEQLEMGAASVLVVFAALGSSTVPGTEQLHCMNWVLPRDPSSFLHCQPFLKTLSVSL